MKFVNKIGLLFIILFYFSVCIAQTDSNKVSYQVKGFIKSDIIMDTRQTVSAREGFVVLYPAKPDLDENGKDKNEGLIFNQFATSSRIIFDINQVKSSELKYRAYLEGDFTGSSNMSYTGFRLRHAYLKIDYKKLQLIAGQYWHPLVAEEVFPDMIGLNLGNPIKSAIRCPQFRLSYNITDFFKTTVSATSQLDNASIGELGSSSIYLRNRAVPNVDIQFQYKREKFILGLLLDYKELLFTKNDSILGLQKSLCKSAAYSVYGKFESSKFMSKAQIMYGGNLYEHAMLGGIANTYENANAFIPIHTSSIWTNIYLKTNKWNVGFFAGYVQNMGANEKIGANIYGRGTDVHSVIRFAPQFMYKASSKLMFFSETEWTQATYGLKDDYGRIKNSKPVANFRENIAVILFF